MSRPHPPTRPSAESGTMPLKSTTHFKSTTDCFISFPSRNADATRPHCPQDGLLTTQDEFTDVYLGLKVTRVFRVARLFVTISFFVQGPSLAFDHSR